MDFFFYFSNILCAVNLKVSTGIQALPSSRYLQSYLNDVHLVSSVVLKLLTKVPYG